MYCIHGSNKSVRYVSPAHLTRLWTGGDIMDVLSLSGILNLILRKAQPAPSIKKEQHSAATSISRQIFIFTLSSVANKRNLDASPQPRLVGESGLTGI